MIRVIRGLVLAFLAAGCSDTSDPPDAKPVQMFDAPGGPPTPDAPPNVDAAPVDAAPVDSLLPDLLGGTDAS